LFDLGFDGFAFEVKGGTEGDCAVGVGWGGIRLGVKKFEVLGFGGGLGFKVEVGDVFPFEAELPTEFFKGGVINGFACEEVADGGER
jgi:hypothetical protein